MIQTLSTAVQLTRFDRWLREKYAYEYRVQTLRPPESLPKGIRAIVLPDTPGRRYKHLFITRKHKAAERLIRTLKENGQMYHTQVVERRSWYVAIVAPKNKSITWWLFSMIVILTGLYFAVSGIHTLFQNPEFRKNFMEALEIMKG